MEPQDAALFRYLRTRKKLSKEEANYREKQEQQYDIKQTMAVVVRRV
jgi:hypothetical protein